jgi:hypothetical protein
MIGKSGQAGLSAVDQSILGQAPGEIDTDSQGYKPGHQFRGAVVFSVRNRMAPALNGLIWSCQSGGCSFVELNRFLCCYTDSCPTAALGPEFAHSYEV